MEHNKLNTYYGKYLGIPYEIVYKSADDVADKYYYQRDRWNYYLYLSEIQFSKDFFNSIWLKGRKSEFLSSAKFLIYDYDQTVISNLEFHGGCTYYRKYAGFDGETRVVKIGCDYSHLFDLDYKYILPDIEEELRNTIQKLHSITTVYDRCQKCGKKFIVDSSNHTYYCDKCKKEHEPK